MKVKIGRYPRFTSLWSFEQFLTELKVPEGRGFEYLAGIMWWVYDLFSWMFKCDERTIRVKLHRHDTINMKETLAHIVTPMLKQLKKNQPGSPMVDDIDIPVELLLENIHVKWVYILDEMIFAFESHTYDWESQYYEYETLVEVAEGPIYLRVSEEAAAITLDRVKRDEHKRRIDRGMGFFAKYYDDLWQ